MFFDNFFNSEVNLGLGDLFSESCFFILSSDDSLGLLDD
jgi:hypothetical protein